MSSRWRNLILERRALLGEALEISPFESGNARHSSRLGQKSSPPKNRRFTSLPPTQSAASQTPALRCRYAGIPSHRRFSPESRRSGRCPVPQHMCSSMESSAGRWKSSAILPTALSMGVGPQANTFGFRISDFGFRSSASSGCVTSPFSPWLPSSVVARTSQPSAANSCSHKISSRRRPPTNTMPFCDERCGQQIHRRHAIAAGDEQRRFAAGVRHGETVAERRDDA